MTSLIDADLVAFRSAATCEAESEIIAHLRCDDMMRKILNTTETVSYKAYLSGANNFRKTICPDYKANRKDLVRPKWLESCREFLVSEWGAIVTDGIEADDELGINQTEDTIICSIDKDLKQIPGRHFNFVKEEFFFVTPLQGMQQFFMQTLIGDTSDNIFGVRGLGPKKSAKIIEPLTDYKEMYNVCRDLYSDPDRFSLNCKLLWILREYNEVWTPDMIFGESNANHNPSDNNNMSNSDVE